MLQFRAGFQDERHTCTSHRDQASQARLACCVARAEYVDMAPHPARRGIRPSVERATERMHGTVEIARARADMVRSEP